MTTRTKIILTTIRKGLNWVSLVSRLNFPQQIVERDIPWTGYPLFLIVLLPLHIYWWFLPLHIYWWICTRGLYWTLTDLMTAYDWVMVLEFLRDNSDYSPWDIISVHDDTIQYGHENLCSRQIQLIPKWIFLIVCWLFLTIFDNKIFWQRQNSIRDDNVKALHWYGCTWKIQSIRYIEL